MTTTVRCPKGHLNVFPGLTLSGVAMYDNGGMNFPVTCRTPGCGLRFDAAPNTPGMAAVVTTGLDGQMRVRQQMVPGTSVPVRDARDGVVQVRNILQDLTPDQLWQVRVALDQVAAGEAEPVTVAAVSPDLESFMKRNPALFAVLCSVLVPVLLTILESLFSMWMEQGQEPAEPPPPPPPQVVVIDHYPTDAELDELVQQEVTRLREHGDRSP